MAAPARPVVLVTGCSAGGIGYELCLAFAARGCQVFATARKLESMAGLQGAAGVQLLSLDVTDVAAAAAAVEAVVADAGRIDVLVNNAGARRAVRPWPCSSACRMSQTHADSSRHA